MNSEVLRRKLFRTVLADSRSPAGILASSPEMVGAVQRRAAGGVNQGDAQYMQAIGQLAQQGDKATLQNIFADTRLSSNVRNAARQALGSLATQKNTSSAPSAGVGIGQGILNAAADQNRKFIDSVKTAASNDVDRVSSLLDFLGVKGSGEVARPIETEGPGIAALIGQGIKKMGSDLRSLTDPIDRKLGYLTYDETEDKGLPTGEATVPGTALPATDLLLPDDDEFGNIGPDGKSVPTDFDFGEEGGLGSAPTVAKTVAEELSETATSSKTPAQDASEEAAKDETKPQKPKAFTPLLTPETVSDLTQGTLEADAENQLAQSTGNAVVDQALSILQGTTEAKSEAEKAKGVDETIGVTGTRKERIEKRKAVLQELLGERAKDIRTDANYNLMMTGLMIAAGENPNMLTNIAKGLATGLKNYGDVVGEEAQAVTKEDRALMMQAASEVGAEITSEKAAALKAEQQRVQRIHENDMQDKRLATSLLNTQVQVGSREALALAEIASRERLAANQFGQNLALFGLKADQENKLLEKRADLQRELANPPTETMRLMETIKAEAARNGDEMSDLEALIAVKRAGATAGKSTDTTNSFNRLVSAGMNTMDAWLLSNSGAVTELIKDMGAEDFQNFVMGKLANQAQQPQNTQNKVTGDEAQKHIDANAAALASGQTTYEVDGKKFGVVQN